MTVHPAIPAPTMRRSLLDLAAFPPPPSASALAAPLGRPIESIVKLDANENPFGPSPLVQEQLSQYASHHLYPDASQAEGCAALSEYTGVPVENLMLGNGGDDLID